MTLQEKTALGVVAVVSAILITLLFISPADCGDHVVGPEPNPLPDNGVAVTAEEPFSRLINSILSRARPPDNGYDESLVPAYGQRSNDIQDYALQARCRDPQIVDPSCGFPYATTPADELRSAADSGDALAMYALGLRTSRRDPLQSLAHYHDALRHGLLDATGPIAAHYAGLAESAPAGEIEVRQLLATEAYAHLIAGTMLLAAPDKMLALIGLRDETFTDIPVTRAACDAAFSIVANLNAERISMGMQPFTVRFGTVEMLRMQQETYGNCT